ncbi:cysteine-rich KTR domain-containing protein [Intestinimonas butyriciproducens]|uniref:cysteine-rich KTR domain-containing protein n=1 Tax=Intestinimonas butyriciproducens TaxID=1297617 RepID=UPI001C10554C|nr:cysteine-rich KTR domain-containing protein [Intestinimonas butyriciproducens]
MQEARDRGKLIVKDRWVICPVCNKGKLLMIRPDTIVRNLPRKCKRCGQETLVNIGAPEPVSTETSA